MVFVQHTKHTANTASPCDMYVSQAGSASSWLSRFTAATVQIVQIATELALIWGTTAQLTTGPSDIQPFQVGFNGDKE